MFKFGNVFFGPWANESGIHQSGGQFLLMERLVVVSWNIWLQKDLSTSDLVSQGLNM